MGNRGGSRVRIHVDEARFRELWGSGATLVQMAAEFGATRSWVSLHAGRLGLPKRATNVGQLPGRAIEIAYREGKTLREIRKALLPVLPTVSERTIAAALRARGVQIRPRTVSPHLVDEASVVRMWRDGLYDGQIAKRLGVHRQVVQRILYARLGPRKAGRRPGIDVRRMWSLLRQGLSHAAVAQQLGCSAGAVNHHVQRAKRAAVSA
jgi:DNA-binding CsgD family transcriptional regulator